ncbi:MAG: polysaccharide biosynthesis/export family protein [Gemmataceae bacterium]|nr:polysaccharide biosynthesis/export family protein [Gemmataceae bacterium]
MKIPVRHVLSTPPSGRHVPRRAILVASVLIALLNGCAATTNPVANGIPVELLPPELLGSSREKKKPIPLNALGRLTSDEYRLGPGDVLGVWVEGVLGDANTPIPIQSAPLIQARDQLVFPPGAGYPVRVDDNGTLFLPQLPPLMVAKLTVVEAREAIRAAYAQAGILRAGREKILVSLLYPRRYPIVVMREEASNLTAGPEGFTSTSKRGSGHEVHLRGDQNDVLHALALTGGLPGLDACDEIIVQRAVDGCPGKPENPAELLPHPPAAPIVRIPLHWPPDEPLPFGPQDVLLYPGDVVIIYPRELDVYYTAGLLPAGEHVLPRNVDLDVVEAICRVRGPLVNGAIAVSNLSGQLIQPGIGNPNPALLCVLRKTRHGGQINIRVDLNRALCDPKERIPVQPGDILVLQEMPSDALARYFSQTFLNFNIFWEAIHSKYITGVLDISAPDRLPGRLGQVNIIR